MASVSANSYAHWRVRCGVVPLLHDDGESPPENLLQAVWQHQRLVRDRLCTLDGRIVRVLHPGFRNVEGGPDFRGAVLQLGDASPVTGDVEVDIRASGWRSHGHDRNPAFQNVVLHVIWDGGHAGASAPPAMAIRQSLDAPLGELSLWLGGEPAKSLGESFRGRCCGPLRELTVEQVMKLLHEAAMVRLQTKAAHLVARARQAGWDQSLWEGMFRALGYKHNTWPMQRLAELRSRWTGPRLSALVAEARLFGLSALLPQELPRGERSAYLRALWDQWWRERDEFADDVLPPAVWRLHGLRPANHPQRRLALASRWASNGAVAASVEKWCERKVPDGELAGSVLELLQVPPDDFWSWHWTFRSPRLKRAQPMLGAGRATDLAVNVILPWLWGRAGEGKNQTVQKTVEQRYFAWPPAEDNSVLRLARQRLLGGAPRRSLTGAAAQQGLIQIVRDFCDHSNAICENCRFPELVRNWKG